MATLRPAIAGLAAIVTIVTIIASAFAQPAAGRLPMREFELVDRVQGGLVAARVTAPVGWQLDGRVDWRYQDVSWPVRPWARVSAPDGRAWVEFFPAERFYWLEPVRAPVAPGARALGMIHLPGVTLEQAMQRFVVGAYRGDRPGLQVLGSRPIPGLAEAFGLPQVQGESMGVRIRWNAAGGPVEEDLYALLGAPQRIPYHGPQGTTYEIHRPLVLVHAVGAAAGQLDSAYPLLGFIARSARPDPAWERHRQQVQAQLNAEFNRQLARGYAQIQAAGAASRAISANNDAMLSSMQATRQAQQQADAARRAAAAQAAARGSPNDEFSQYIRGTQRMNDPYWGQSEQSSGQRYHWTDGSGNYRSSNDPTFNPNVGAGGGVTWQRMEPAGR